MKRKQTVPDELYPGNKMTSAERLEIAKIVRSRSKLAMQDLDVRAAQQHAQIEQQLAKRYPPTHHLWAEVVSQAEEVLNQVDAKIAAICKDIGVVPEFRPSVHLAWYDRGENADKKRRQELRSMAEARIEAITQKAKLQIRRNEVEILTQLAADGFTTEAAKQMLASLPTAEALMPQVLLAELEQMRPIPQLTDNVDVED
jgi:hypothetical protein